jgi:MFS family permease
VFAISFLIIGFGTSWQDAQTNSIVNRFEKPEMRMQFLHAAYGGWGVLITTTTTSPQGSRTDVNLLSASRTGIGATTAPLVATLFVTHIHRFYHYYIVSLCLAISNFILLVFVFRFKRTEELVGGDGSWKGEMGREEKKMLKREAKEREGQIELQDGGGVQRNEDGVNMEMSVIGNPRLSKVEEGVPVISNDENSGKKFKRILRDKRVYCLAVFLLLYVGLEVGGKLMFRSFNVLCGPLIGGIPDATRSQSVRIFLSLLTNIISCYHPDHHLLHLILISPLRQAAG